MGCLQCVSLVLVSVLSLQCAMLLINSVFSVMFAVCCVAGWRLFFKCGVFFSFVFMKLWNIMNSAFVHC